MRNPHDSQPVPRERERLDLRSLATKICISVTVAVGLLAAGECAAYFRLPGQTRSRGIYKAFVLWQAARPTDGWISVDADGLRRTTNSHCEANEYTIWIFGSSTLFDEPNRDGDTIPSVLARHYEESGRPVCFKNYGQPGWVSTQELLELLLELKHAERKPDLVIFYDGVVDSFLAFDADGADVHQGYWEFKERFESWRVEEHAGFEYLRSTNTFLALQNIARKYLLIERAGVVPVSSPDRARRLAHKTLDNYQKNMHIVSILAADYGFKYLFLWEPWILAQKPLSDREKVITGKMEKNIPNRIEVARATYELLQTVNQPHFVNLGDVFKDHPETLYVNPAQLRKEGNALVAERIFQILQHAGS